MSFDILVATRLPPSRAMVEAFVKQSGWRIKVEGDLAGDTGNMIGESTSLFRRSRPVFILSGPFPAENEDLPGPVRGVIRGAAFQLEMNLPWGVVGTKDQARCFGLCEHLARECDGAVYDPQDDALVFPDMPAKRRRREPMLTPIRQLTLEWYLAATDAGRGRRFLDLATNISPEALPTRFGRHEPLGHKFSDADDHAAFLDLWSDDLLFFWKAKRPVFGGSLGRSPEREAPPGERRRVRLSIDIDATRIGDDPPAWDRAVELFARVGEDLGAFFGAGYVTRGVLAGARGAQWHGSETENFGFDWINGPWWKGLPAKATWLSWYGEPYRAGVADALEGRATEHGGGLLVRLGLVPLDSDEVRGLAPRLPTDLVVGMTPRYGPVPNKDTDEPILLLYDRSPAKVIPRLR